MDPYPAQTAGFDPLEQYGASLVPGMADPTAAEGLAFRDIMRLPDLYRAGPTTGYEDTSQIPAFRSYMDALGLGRLSSPENPDFNDQEMIGPERRPPGPGGPGVRPGGGIEIDPFTGQPYWEGKPLDPNDETGEPWRPPPGRTGPPPPPQPGPDESVPAPSGGRGRRPGVISREGAQMAGGEDEIPYGDDVALPERGRRGRRSFGGYDPSSPWYGQDVRLSDVMSVGQAQGGALGGPSYTPSAAAPVDPSLRFQRNGRLDPNSPEKAAYDAYMKTPEGIAEMRAYTEGQSRAADQRALATDAATDYSGFTRDSEGNLRTAGGYRPGSHDVRGGLAHPIQSNDEEAPGARDFNRMSQAERERFFDAYMANREAQSARAHGTQAGGAQQASVGAESSARAPITLKKGQDYRLQDVMQAGGGAMTGGNMYSAAGVPGWDTPGVMPPTTPAPGNPPRGTPVPAPRGPRDNPPPYVPPRGGPGQPAPGPFPTPTSGPRLSPDVTNPTSRLTGGMTLEESPGVALSQRRISGQGLTQNPEILAALDAHRKLVTPGIENQYTLSGLGRSTALPQALALSEASLLPGLYEGAFGREERGLERELGATEQELGRRERSSVRGAEATQAGIDRMLGLSSGLTGRRAGTAQLASQMGGERRGVSQQALDRQYDDFLRRMGITESATTGPFGILSGGALGSATRGSGGGLFK